MRFHHYLLAILIFLAACTTNRKLSKIDIKDQESGMKDSVEYEIIIFDSGFETWFLTHSKPVWYHSVEYYESWNKQYVVAWNSKAMSPRYSKYFESTIDYDPNISYGLELNHKLFYYFMYVEKALKIDILPSGMGPHSVL
jgi:hypothetical protein